MTPAEKKAVEILRKAYPVAVPNYSDEAYYEVSKEDLAFKLLIEMWNAAIDEMGKSLEWCTHPDYIKQSILKIKNHE